MKLKVALAITLSLSLGLAACSSEETKDATATSNTTKPATTSAATTTSASETTSAEETPAVKVACEESAPGASPVKLTGATITASGTDQPEGTKTITWEYSGDVSTSSAAFGVITKRAARMLKFDAGQLVSNTYTEFGGNPVELDADVSLTEKKQQAIIPAEVAAAFDEGWVADLSIDGTRVGTCYSDNY
ncbi:MAG: hypothetical protein Q4D85_08135 [Corynebacterium sp.]|uniref:hypothetical protein n=1 Tax=Corynebacterium sp. TaxID=1720 RepID=UPI0026DD9ADA|nr:hypothetical protein [Corynebacterium sp.]MDO5098715.1 hypothetical protein [Corynebacterium sp.]